MCRFMMFKGTKPILLSKLILEPTHSILNQATDPRLLITAGQTHLGDGFGIGYYTDASLGPEPCVFTSITPAWNCTNLPRIASKTTSTLLFAHMRATTEGALSDQNCHPFAHGSLMFMHNGGLAGWRHYKRRFAQRLADKWYLGVQGGTDSEWCFALFLDTLERMGHDPSACPVDGFGPGVLRAALLRTIAQINEMVAAIPRAALAGEPLRPSWLNFAVSDGASIVCTRYVASRTNEAASLYYSTGSTWEDASQTGEYQMTRRDRGADVIIVASEPLTFERESWVTVPTNSVLTIHKRTVMVHPILDENYNLSPDQVRSSKPAREQGLSTNESFGLPTAALPDANDVSKQLGHSSLDSEISAPHTNDQNHVAAALRHLVIDQRPVATT